MSVTTIADLPQNILINILEYLDYEELEKLTLVSKDWFNTISTTSKFNKMSEIELHINENEIRVLKLEKKYRKISIKLSFYPDDDEKQNLFEFLQCCTTAEELFIKHQNLPKDKSSSIYPLVVELPHLKKLTVWNCDWILKCVKCDNLESIEIFPAILPERNFDIINMFLTTCNKLKAINLRAVNLGSVIIMHPNFKWKKLELHPRNMKERSPSEIKNWRKLVEASDDNSSIDLDGVYIDKDFLRFVLIETAANIKISKLTLGFVKNIDETLVQDLNVMSGIKVLIWKCNNRDDNVELLFKKIPNLTTLEIQFPSYNEFKIKEFVGELKNLKHVKVTFWDRDFATFKLDEILKKLKKCFQSTEEFEIINTFTAKVYKFMKNE